jgi:hypothetical protein
VQGPRKLGAALQACFELGGLFLWAESRPSEPFPRIREWITYQPGNKLSHACHAGLDPASSFIPWILAFARMTLVNYLIAGVI